MNSWLKKILWGSVCLLIGVFSALEYRVCQQMVEAPGGANDFSLFKDMGRTSLVAAIVFLILGIWLIIHGIRSRGGS